MPRTPSNAEFFADFGIDGPVSPPKPGPRIHDAFEQGSIQWLGARCGLLTASEMKLIVTPTLKAASNYKERAHLYELAAQRISRYVEPHYISDDMLRGHEDEVRAKLAYAEHFAPVTDCGFITNDRWGFTIGYSPDGLVGDDGQIECKSRRQKFQVQTIAEGGCPADYMIQVQTGLLVSERSWCDFVSYSGGLPMHYARIYPDPIMADAIINAAGEFERRLAAKLDAYHAAVAAMSPVIATERVIEQEMHV